MQIGFVGLGAVVETAYLPALQTTFGASLCCLGFDIQPAKTHDGNTHCP
jgi:hypothetical protein